MNRRNFLQSFILTLLTLLFGPKVVAAMTEEQIGMANRLRLFDDAMAARDAIRAYRGQPNTLVVSPAVYAEMCAVLS